MHLIKDENGNPLAHGHAHGEEHGQAHPRGEGAHGTGEPKKEALALLDYMLHHNEHHACELDQMADNLEKLGLFVPASAIRDAVSDFQKGNMRLGLALSALKSEILNDQEG